jgi:hypothetical protein
MLFKKEKAPPVPPEGTYRAAVTSLEEKKSAGGRKFTKWLFTITKGDFAGSTAEGTTDAEWVEGRKLDRWFTACGVSGDAKIDAKFDSAELSGKKVKIVVVNQSFFRKDGSPGTRAKVMDVLPRH